MKKRTRILILEDDSYDVELNLHQLNRMNLDFDYRVVDKGDTYEQALEEFKPDLILSDYTLPGYNGLEALFLALKRLPFTPFIFVTGSINEETAVDCIKKGAWDYVLKDQINHLPAAIRNAFKLKRELEEKRKAEEEKNRSDLLYRMLFDNSNDAIFLVHDNVFIDCNEKTLDMFSCERDDIIGKTPYQFSPEVQENGRKSEELAQEKMQAALSGKKQFFEWLHKRKNGECFNAEVTLNRLELMDKVYLQAFVRDISERKKALTELTRNEEKYRYLFEYANDIIWITDREGKFISINKMFEDILGYSRDKILGTQSLSLIISKDKIKSIEYYKQALKGNQVEYEVKVRTRKGEDRLFWLRLKPMYEKGEIIGLHGIGRDITDRWKAEQALKESESLKKAVIEGSPIGISVRGVNGRLLLYNQAWVNIWALTDDEVNSYRKIRKNLIFDERDSYLGEHINRVREIYEKGGDYTIPELRLVKERPGKAKWISQHFYAIDNEDGIVDKVVILTSDITELKMIHDKLEASLSEKEVLLKEVHHRVKNNMQIISSLLKLQSRYVKDKEALDLFDESQNRVKSMSLIHEKLYQSKNFSEIDLESYVKSLTVNLFNNFGVDPAQIELETRIRDIKIKITSAIPCGLIINELITNSIKYAFPEGRKGKIKVSVTKSDQGKLKMVISDNGIGLPGELDMENPQTLGLQLVSALSKQIHSELKVEKKQGTRFQFLFEDLDRTGKLKKRK